MPSRCGVLPSASVVELALGVDALDAGVDVGLLILVDPSGWDPFGESVGVDAASPAFLQEMGVVVSAQQSQIFKISWAAEDPIQDVVSVAPLGWVGAAGEAAAGVSGNQRHGLTAGGQPLGSAEC
jgi:hypothetical protein